MRYLCLLGPPSIAQGKFVHSAVTDEAAVTVPRFRSRRTVGLLAYLVLKRRPVAREHLASFFWPDVPSSKGRANLSRELHNLAQILPDCWESNRQAVTFIPSSNTTVDLYSWLALEAEERWEEAVGLLRGELLEGLYLDDNPVFENWLLVERERWRERVGDVLRHVIVGRMRRARYADALDIARRLLQFAPWDEETHRQVMCLLAWTGQRGAALRHFEICRRILKEELDIEPACATNDLYRQIQAGTLALPPQLPAYLSDEKARKEYKRPLFVGRDSELAKLDRFLASALAGQGKVIFITGGPGRGKTALLEAFSQQVMDHYPDLLVAGGKCNAYSDLGDPYLPFREVLAMLTGDVEGRWDAGAVSREHARRLWSAYSLVVHTLLDHGSHLLDVLVPGEALLSRALIAGFQSAPWLPRLRIQVNRDWTSRMEVEQSHLFQQVTNVLHLVSQERPLLLILDDIQWADPASITLLFHLGRYLASANSKLLIACAYRPEEVELGRNGRRHPLAKVLSELKRTFGDVWVHLGRADEGEALAFVDALLDSQPNRLGGAFRSALVDRTEGHPLFTVELLRTMQSCGHLIKDADGTWIASTALDWDVLPARVEAVVAERIDRLDPELRALLSAAAVEGERFTAQVVAQVLNKPAKLIFSRLSQDLERQHRLISESEEVETESGRLSRFRFGHHLFQDYLCQQLSRAEIRLLHGEIGMALEELYQGQLDENAMQLARHFQQSGNHQKAFHYFVLAAECAERRYESREAISHYSRALQLADRVSPDASLLAKIYRGRGLAYTSLGEFERARRDHKLILQLARTAGLQQTAWQANIDLGRLWASRNYSQARDHFIAALDLAQCLDEPALQAISLNWMGNWCANDENPKRAVRYHQQSLQIFEELGDRRQMALTLDLLGIAHLLQGDLTASVRYYDRSIATLRVLNDRPRLVSSLIARAINVSILLTLASLPPVPIPDAERNFAEAIGIAHEIGLATDEAWAYWGLGQMYTVHGDFGRALEAVQKGLHISDEIGHREWLVANRWAQGLIYAELLAPEEALPQLEHALLMARELNSQNLINDVCATLSGAYLLLEDKTKAQACLNLVLSSETPMDTVGRRYCWVRRAELALAQGNSNLALDITERLIASTPGMSPERAVTYLWMLKAEAIMALGNTANPGQERVLPLLLAAKQNAQVTGERFLLWRLNASLARCFHTLRRRQEAENALSEAQALIDEMASTIPDQRLLNTFRCSAYRILEMPPY